jgi:hypothetical protein
MLLARTRPLSRDDAEIKIFHCKDCGHELRLTVWTDRVVPITPIARHNLAA